MHYSCLPLSVVQSPYMYSEFYLDINIDSYFFYSYLNGDLDCHSYDDLDMMNHYNGLDNQFNRDLYSDIGSQLYSYIGDKFKQ